MGENDEKYIKLPVIALTANAIKSAKAMFLSNGFNDFISKPIDTSELVRVLKEWLPAEKISEAAVGENNAFPKDGREDCFITNLERIEEINVKIGLERVSGVAEMYHDSVVFFNKKLLLECDKMSEALRENDMKAFSITVHAIKSSLSTIGAMQLSEEAEKLETAAKNNEDGFCAENYPPFEEKLHKLQERLTAIFGDDEEDDGNRPAGDEAALREGVEKAIAAADDFDSDTGIKIIGELVKYDYGEEKNGLLSSALAAFNDFDCGTASDKLKLIK
jgi:HPt (histidine-containing phosphotransfer) domain-containing protein